MLRRRASLTAASVLLMLAAPAQAQLDEGRRLYDESCASCHGPEGAGTDLGPPLTGVGAAAADFQLRTGRMPLADAADQAVRKPQAFDDAEIRALVAYVGSLGEGPPVPSVDPEAGDLAAGQALFVDNCAACHGATANGGAAGVDAIAPSLYLASPLDVAEATITGPGQMPVFDFTNDERNSLARFISYLQTREDPGGADIGGIGPVPEGFVAWGLGLGSLVLVALAIGTRTKRRAT